ncbi:MAG: hypothetical protein KDF59_12775, partial [Nitrosomonas sp.]|nr:hypothetical protein [Nitrosomonas sp.]
NLIVHSLMDAFISYRLRKMNTDGRTSGDNIIKESSRRCMAIPRFIQLHYIKNRSEGDNL